MAAPATPSNFNVQQGNGSVLVSWDNSISATSYHVYRSLDNVTFALLTSPAPLKSSLTFANEVPELLEAHMSCPSTINSEFVLLESIPFAPFAIASVVIPRTPEVADWLPCAFSMVGNPMFDKYGAVGILNLKYRSKADNYILKHSALALPTYDIVVFVSGQ